MSEPPQYASAVEYAAGLRARIAKLEQDNREANERAAYWQRNAEPSSELVNAVVEAARRWSNAAEGWTSLQDDNLAIELAQARIDTRLALSALSTAGPKSP